MRSSGHVTLSELCPINSPWALSYRQSIRTIPVSGFISDHISPKVATKIITWWRHQWRHKARINYPWGLYRHTVYRNIVTGWVVAMALSMGKVGISTTPASKTPKLIDTKLGVSKYVGDLTLTSKYGSNWSTWVVWAHAWNITVCDLSFFVSSPRLQVATVDRFGRSIRQNARFRTRRCLLGSRW